MDLKSTLIYQKVNFCFKKSIALLAFSFCVLNGFSQIAAYNVNGQTGYGTSPLAATTADPNSIVGGLTRGNGVVTGGGAAGNAWGGTGWNYATPALAIAANTYIAFTIAPNVGNSLSLANFNMFYRRSGTSATSMLVQYSIDNSTYNDISTAALGSSSSSGASITPISLGSITDLQNVTSPTTITIRLIPYGATSAGGSFYAYYNNTTTNAISVTGSSILPITLSSFSGVKSAASNLISWTTANAQNFSHFELERKTDGRNFSQIAAFQPNATGSYSYADNQPLAINYYRLKMIDKDGTASYSKVVAIVNASQGFAVSNVYPTLTTGLVTVEAFAATATKINCSVVNMAGQQVLAQAYTADQSFKQTIDISSLAKGSYILKLSTESGQSTFKLVKQ